MRLLKPVLNRIHRCVKPCVPRRYQLAYQYHVARLLDCERELVYLPRFGPNRGIAVDIGANDGLYTHRLSKFYDYVHAFEISPPLAERLRRLGPKNLTVHPVGLSARERKGTLLTPICRGHRLPGWASLEPGNCPGAERYEEMAVELRTLDSYHLEGVTFLKADVEGHELDLLAGAKSTIERNRPVILVEVRDSNVSAVRTFLRNLGYREVCLMDLVGVEGTLGNYIFLPT